MIRPLTCVCMLLAGGAGLYLYQVKHHAQLLDRQIEETVKQTNAAHERVRMMRAEWALLNEPERLQDLSEHFLQLKPMAPSQFVQLSELASRLPSPVVGASRAPSVTTTDGGSDDDDNDMGAPEPVAQQPVAPPVPIAADMAPSTPHPSVSAKTAEVDLHKLPHPAHDAAQHEAVSHDRAAHDLARVQPPRVVTPHREQLADRRDHNPLVRPVPLAAPRPVGARVLSAMGTPVAQAQQPIYRAPEVQRVSAYVPPSSLAMASSLGMARTMLPPPAPVANSAYR